MQQLFMQITFAQESTIPDASVTLSKILRSIFEVLSNSKYHSPEDLPPSFRADTIKADHPLVWKYLEFLNEHYTADLNFLDIGNSIPQPFSEGGKLCFTQLVSDLADWRPLADFLQSELGAEDSVVVDVVAMLNRSRPAEPVGVHAALLDAAKEAQEHIRQIDPKYCFALAGRELDDAIRHAASGKECSDILINDQLDNSLVVRVFGYKNQITLEARDYPDISLHLMFEFGELRVIGYGDRYIEGVAGHCDFTQTLVKNLTFTIARLKGDA